MRYFDLIDDMSSARRWHVGRIYLPDGSAPRLRAGIKFDGPHLLRAEVHHVGRVLDFCVTSFNVPIAIPVIAEVIQGIVGSDIQCLPLSIGGQSGMMVLNALRRIRCINEERSEFLKFSEDDPVRPDLAGHYRSVTKMVLDRTAIPTDAHFFRIALWEVVLVVSETVKNAMERVGCHGAQFTELEMA